MATASSLYLPAGSNKQSGAGGTAKECLTFTERPTTPPEVKKYRKSSYLEPGARFKHYGIVDDLKKMNLDEIKDEYENIIKDLEDKIKDLEETKINELQEQVSSLKKDNKKLLKKILESKNK